MIERKFLLNTSQSVNVTSAGVCFKTSSVVYVRILSEQEFDGDFYLFRSCLRLKPSIPQSSLNTSKFNLHLSWLLFWP